MLLVQSPITRVAASTLYVYHYDHWLRKTFFARTVHELNFSAFQPVNLK
jgi:hypothetical protein